MSRRYDPGVVRIQSRRRKSEALDRHATVDDGDSAGTTLSGTVNSNEVAVEYSFVDEATNSCHY